MQYPIYLADFETTTQNTNYFKRTNDAIVYIGYMENLNTEENYKFNYIDDFLKTIKNLKKSCVIYFHNLSFDGYFILKALLKNHEEYFTELPKRKCGFSCLRNGNKIYEIRYQFCANQKYYTIFFKCSLRMLSVSVEALGNMYNINKYTGNETENFYDNEPLGDWNKYPVEFTQYLMRDVKIVKKAVIDAINITETLPFYNSWDKPPRFADFLTIGALCYKYQNNAFMQFFQGNKTLKINKATYDFAQKTFSGGWTQFNPSIQNKLQATPNGFSCDINSAHPFSMTKLLPYGDIYNNNETPFPQSKHLVWYEINIKSAHAIYPQVVNLLNWNKRHKVNLSQEQYINRYCQVQFNFTCFYLKEEWELLQKFYIFTGVKIINKYWAHADYYLKEFVEHLYNLRLELKDKKQDALTHSIKIMLNAGYGKHATREDFDTEIVLKKADAKHFWNDKNGKYDGIITKDNLEFQILHENVNFKTDKYVVLVCHPLSQKQWLYNKLAASAITAYTRINLWTTLLNVGPKYFLYGDTDSLYFSSGNQNNVDIDARRLGAYKIEHTGFKYFMTNGAKVYCLFDENKNPIEARYSGINRKFLKRHMSLEMFKNQENVLALANLKPLYLKSGIILVWSDYQPKKRNF